VKTFLDGTHGICATGGAHTVHTIGSNFVAGILSALRIPPCTRLPTLIASLAWPAASVRAEWHGMLFGTELADVGTSVETARHMARAGVLVSQFGPVIRCLPAFGILNEFLESGLAIRTEAVPRG
jgi:acetylornithine/succinyldiaminopimelate/putrescine aminotransferase